MIYIQNQEERSIIIEEKDLHENLYDILDQVNDNLYKILEEGVDSNIYQSNPKIAEVDINIFKKLFRKKTSNIRDILNKYLLSENLNFLISNGCSLYAGSQAINGSDAADYKELISNFSLVEHEKLEEKVHSLVDKRPELILDSLYEILSYCKNIIVEEDIIHKFEILVLNFKELFVKQFVLPIDYSNNELHKFFLKKLMSRDSQLSKINIFTLNYDLLLEKTAEELGINVNSGFMGFHNRVFNPSVFHMDIHINQSSGKKTYGKGINLFKLHGSISWEFDSNKTPYGIIENQQNFEQIDFENIPECIIYPVQSKKKYSLDIPYSEMFRQFIEFVNRPDSTLIIMGYSFLDEHVNDIITNALANPDFNLIVFSYQTINDSNLSPYMKQLINRSREDARITIFFGNILGDFKYIVKYLMPYPYQEEPEKIFYETFQHLKGGKL